MYINEHVCPVTQSQLRSLHDLRVPTHHHNEETHLSGPGHPEERGQTFQGSTEGYNKTKGEGGM